MDFLREQLDKEYKRTHNLIAALAALALAASNNSRDTFGLHSQVARVLRSLLHSPNLKVIRLLV